MRRLLHVLVWLYPRSWRARYGEEFLALIEDIEPRWHDVWNLFTTGLTTRGMAMKSWQWIGLGALVGFAVHGGMLLQHPADYRSEAQMKVSATGSFADVEPQVQKILEASVTRKWLLPLIQRHHLYEAEMASGREQAALENFGNEHLMFDGSHETGGAQSLRIAVTTADPSISRAVVRDVYAHINEVAQLNSSPIRFELAGEPNLPSYSTRWDHAPEYLGSGVAFGAGLGLVVVLLTKGWRKFAAKS